MELVEQTDLEFENKQKDSKLKINFNKVKIIFTLRIYQAFTNWIKHSQYAEENSGKNFP